MPSVPQNPAQPGPLPQDSNVATPEFLARVEEWYNLKVQVAELSAREGELRRTLAAEGFPSAQEKGTERLAIGYGKDLKLTTKVNYTIDRELMAEARTTLDPEVFDRVVRWKPEVVESEFLRVSDPATRELLSGFITSRPGTPGLEIVDRKKR